MLIPPRKIKKEVIQANERLHILSTLQNSISYLEGASQSNHN